MTDINPSKYQGLKAWWNSYDKILSKLGLALALLAGVIVFFLMLVTDVNIIGRYFFNKPIGSTVDIAILIFVILMVLPQAHVQQNWGHLGIEFVYERVSPKAKIIMRLIVLALLLPMSTLVTIYSIKYAIRHLDNYFFGLIQIPYWPALLSISIAFGLFALCALNQLIKGFMSLYELKEGKSQ